MSFGRRIGDTLRVPGRGVRRVVVVVVVLATAASVGGAVALTAPLLVTRLTAAPPVIAPPVPQAVLGPLPADAPLPTTGGLAAALDAGAEDVPGRFTGIVLDPATGTALWGLEPERALVPGSTGKILTGSAALLTLNPTEGFVTSAVAGPDPGSVVLVGGGDPTLTALPEGEFGVYPDPARLTALAAQVEEAVQEPITQVLIDTSRYRGPTLHPSWDPDDVNAGFVAPIEALMVDGGRVDPTLVDSPRRSKPALAAGRAFAELLGVDPDTVEEAPEAVEGATATGASAADEQDGARRLGAVASPRFSELVEHVLRSSDNVLAEALAREVAVAREGEPSFEGAAEQTLAALAQAGFDPTGAVLVDGSGLSTEDRVPARLLGALLGAAAAPAEAGDTEFLRPVLTGLPVAGGDGTLDERFAPDDDSAPGRGVVRAKTGTLTGVSSLAGVVTDADGRLLVFALMSNGGSTATVRPRLDDLAAALSRCGCR